MGKWHCKNWYIKRFSKTMFGVYIIFLNDSYDFKNGDVLFKPTKASKQQFRPTFEMAISYFLGSKRFLLLRR